MVFSPPAPLAPSPGHAPGAAGGMVAHGSEAFGGKTGVIEGMAHEHAVERWYTGVREHIRRRNPSFWGRQASALELCTALKARGQDCLVVKR